METIDIEICYCQTLKRNIAGQSCREIQGQDGCFGCAAPSRLCVACKQSLVKVPAVGLCSQCLTLQLAQEIKEDQPALNSRLCEKCEERPVRFPQYDLCLACSVAEFGEKNKLHQESADMIIMEEKLNQDKEKEANNMDQNPKEQLCKNCNSEPSYVKGLGRRCYMAQYKESIKRTKADQIATLVLSAKELIFSTQTFSKDFLRKKLKIGCQLGDIITEQLEKEGVIRQISSGAHRYWKLNVSNIPQKPTQIKKAAASAPLSTPNLKTDEKIVKLKALIQVVGPDSELTGILEEMIKYLPIIEQIQKLR